ncbi:hypothetical protein BGZ52_011010, partial [Haplosporangium bisporale]
GAFQYLLDHDHRTGPRKEVCLQEGCPRSLPRCQEGRRQGPRQPLDREDPQELWRRSGCPAHQGPLPLRQVARICSPSASAQDPQPAPQGPPSLEPVHSGLGQEHCHPAVQARQQ